MYDYIIIGAGSAGCVLANRLTTDPKISVLLLEAGGKDSNPKIKIPAAWPTLLKTKIDWGYYSEPMEHVNDRRIFMPRGKTLGGSSAINAMFYMRGNRLDYDDWSKNGASGWSYEEVLPYFKKSERNQRLKNKYHGNDGELWVSDQQELNLMSEKFLLAVQETGFPANNDFNGADQMGFGVLQSTIKNGERHSAAAAFLKPILNRPNLHVVTNAHTQRIDFEGKKAVGVTYRQGGKIITERCGREVICCAGGLHSPQLLMLSGIGDAVQLRSKGIEVVLDLKGVGQNLQDHPFTMLIADSTYKKTLDTAETLGNFLKYFLTKRGPLTSTIAETNGFWKSRPDLPAPDLQIAFGAAYFIDHGFVRPKGNGFSLGPCLVAPKSRGYVALQSNDPNDAPLMQPNHLSHADDLAALTAGYRIADRILHTPTLQAYFKSYYFPQKRLTEDSEIHEHIRASLEALYHPVGTCKMGTDADAVVSPTLQVHGIEGLRVVDASVMPTIIRGNTNAPTMMIAEKAADMILGR